MKREGRQHGLVQTHPIIQSTWSSRRINKFESPATAGLFTKVPQKPTNHSKFTGKCGRPRCASCHIHPAGKAKDKTKGTQKLKSCNVVTNHRLVTWRVVDARPGLNITGFSATGILDHLANDYIDDGDDYTDDNPDAEGVYDSGSYSYAYDLALHDQPDWKFDSEIASRTVAIEELDEFDGDYNKGDGDDDEKMSFCDVGFAWEQVEGDVDGWCLVDEI